MLKLSCSSTKPGDEAIPGTGACVGQSEPSVGGYRPIRARESWGAQLPGLRGVVNTQLGATGYTAQTGETLSSLTILCGCRLWGYTNVSQWGESVFNYDVVCCLKLTRYEMRRCLPTSGKSWTAEKNLTHGLISGDGWLVALIIDSLVPELAHSNLGPGISRVLGLFPPSNFLLLKLFDLFSLFSAGLRSQQWAPWLSVSVANVVRNSFCVQNCTTRYLSKSDLLNQANTFLHSHSYR